MPELEAASHNNPMPLDPSRFSLSNGRDHPLAGQEDEMIDLIEDIFVDHSNHTEELYGENNTRRASQPLFPLHLYPTYHPSALTLGKSIESNSFTQLDHTAHQTGSFIGRGLPQSCHNMYDPQMNGGFAPSYINAEFIPLHPDVYFPETSELPIIKMEQRSSGKQNLGKRSRDESIMTYNKHLQTKKRKPLKVNRFFWTDELHRDFLQAILRLGLDQDKPEEILYLLQLTKPDAAPDNFQNQKAVSNALEALREKFDDCLIPFIRSIRAACERAASVTKINQRKGGHPAFHVYPFPINKETTCTDLNTALNLQSVALEDTTVGLRFVSAVFDLGLKYARPKTIFAAIQPRPSDMTPGSIKSHLQKYRANCKPTRKMFMQQFGPNDACRTANIDVQTSKA